MKEWEKKTICLQAEYRELTENRLKDINGKRKCTRDYSVREYSRIEVTATMSSVRPLLFQNAPSNRAFCGKQRAERLSESWNNEGVRAEMRTRRNCDAVQLKRGLDAERSVHFLLGVNWKCSYLSCAMECAREIRKDEENDPSWQLAKP